MLDQANEPIDANARREMLNDAMAQIHIKNPPQPNGKRKPRYLYCNADLETEIEYLRALRIAQNEQAELAAIATYVERETPQGIVRDAVRLAITLAENGYYR